MIIEKEYNCQYNYIDTYKEMPPYAKTSFEIKKEEKIYLTEFSDKLGRSFGFLPSWLSVHCVKSLVALYIPLYYSSFIQCDVSTEMMLSHISSVQW